MAVTLGRIWRIMKGVHLAVITMFLLAADMAAGYVCLKGNEDLFDPLNRLGFTRWSSTYATVYPQDTWWLFLLFGLLFILAINTLTCTTSKALPLFKRCRGHGSLILKLSMHVMHYALIIILFGLLASYTFPGRYTSSLIAVKGEYTRIPGTKMHLELISSDIDYYHGNRMRYLEGRAISARFIIAISSGEMTRTGTIGINSPFFLRGLGFYLEDFGPKNNSSMNDTPYIRLQIKRDRGTIIYLSGTLLFMIGLILYLFHVSFKKQDGKTNPISTIEEA